MKYFSAGLISILPATRLYCLKAYLWRLSGYKLEKNVRICSSAKLMVFHLSIGKNTFIGHRTMILGGDSTITIGKNCEISSNVMISSGTHNITPLSNKIAGAGYSKNITIGDGVWIGISSTILAGVRIGDMSIIAAGSVVNKDIPPYCIAGGVPCKPIKIWNQEKKKWERV